MEISAQCAPPGRDPSAASAENFYNWLEYEKVTGCNWCTHGGDSEPHHLFAEYVPVAVCQRRVGPIGARWIRVQIAGDENSSFTQHRSSEMQFAGATPGDWGNWPTKLSGNRLRTRSIRSLQTSLQSRLVWSFPR